MSAFERDGLLIIKNVVFTEKYPLAPAEGIFIYFLLYGSSDTSLFPKNRKQYMAIFICNRIPSYTICSACRLEIDLLSGKSLNKYQKSMS